MTDNLEPAERGGVPIDRRRRGEMRSSKYVSPGEGTPKWTLEFDTKAWCAPCRNWRSSKHVDQHAIVATGGKPPRDYKP